MHQEVLTQDGKKIFPLLKNFKAFYLAGGTALALQIGHRVSVDFDLFSRQKIDSGLYGQCKKIFLGEEIIPFINNPDELTLSVGRVKTTFLAYDFPVILKLEKLKGLSLLSIKEIAATKAYTIGRRGSYKDYVDLYFIFSSRHASLENTIKLAQKKYGVEFNSRLFLEQLVYLEDVQDEGIVFLKKKVNKDDLRKFFEKEIRKIKL